MLTQDDLQKIGAVVEKKIETQLERGLHPIKKDLKDVKKRVRKLEKTVDAVIDHFDGRLTKVEIKVVKMENHLNLSPKN